MMQVAVLSIAVVVAAQSAPAAELAPGYMQTDDSRDRARREPPPDTGALYHLTWYGADYAATAALAGVAWGLWPMLEPQPALYGPRFDDAEPDLAAIQEPGLDRTIGAPYRENTVPDLWLYLGGGTLALAAVGYESVRYQDWHAVHNLVLGGAEAVVMTYAVTEAIKTGVGRLRPDFRDRATRYYCNPELGLRGSIAGLDCSVPDSDGVYMDQKDMRDGHRSFPSGHSSSAFALATYFALYLGGETVWGEHASEWSVPVGATLMTGLLGLAATVAATRVSDGRHHLDDVAAGALVGSASSALFYFLHHDLKGRPTYRGLTVAPVALSDGAALQLALRF
ncbi:MAG: phosphatase PAP2 family protein [Deltaproteobacteria bacterium]|nr:phosphatase PAP2 family protein [Deltaproteobacteria bacterium]